MLASLKETFPESIGRSGRVLLPAGPRARASPQREVREVGGHRARGRPRPWSASGTAERQGWIADLADRGVFGRKDEGGFARSADWRVEADRILAQRKTKEGRTMKFEKTPGWLDWYDGPRRRVQAAARQRRRALPRVRPWRRVRLLRRSASTRRATPSRSSCSRCATTWDLRATCSCRPPATVPTTAPWPMPADHRTARRAVLPR